MCLKEFSTRALSSSESCARNSGKTSELRDPVSSPWSQLPSNSHDSLPHRAVCVSFPRHLAGRVLPSLKETWDSSGAGCPTGDTIPCFKSRWGPYNPGTGKRLFHKTISPRRPRRLKTRTTAQTSPGRQPHRWGWLCSNCALFIYLEPRKMILMNLSARQE